MISSLPTIAKAAEQVRSGDLDPGLLVDLCLERIDRFEEDIQAWVVVDREGARRQAVELANRIRQGQPAGMLAGIPVGIKDIIDVAGLPTEAGSPLRVHHVATHDAPLVAGLREADAIILGKTVTTEFACFDPPPTRNPWNHQHTPGGSSSGSAAATALQMCAAAVGTQTGGSIVRPASYCGIAGLKPTFGAVNLRGVVPVSGRLDHAGPMARTVDDLAWLYLVMAEPDFVARSLTDFTPGIAEAGHPGEEAAAKTWREHRTASQAPPRLMLLEADFLLQADAAVESLTRAALSCLAAAELVPVTMPRSYGRVHSSHRAIMAHDAAAYHRDAFRERPEAFGANLAGLIEEGRAVSDTALASALEHQRQFRSDLLELFVDGAMAILPATNTAAVPDLDTTGDPRFSSPWSYAGIPAVSIPCGLTPEGLPCGLQLVGPPHSELRLLAAAAWCEARLGWKGLD
jgi:aspartyl-tRNA(Asn)/glutamyl-tRNA(Gln) amidotransferase subunit A